MKQPRKITLFLKLWIFLIATISVIHNDAYNVKTRVDVHLHDYTIIRVYDYIDYPITRNYTIILEFVCFFYFTT